MSEFLVSCRPSAIEGAEEWGHDIGDAIAYQVFVFSAGDVIAGCCCGGNRLVLLYLLQSWG